MAYVGLALVLVLSVLSGRRSRPISSALILAPTLALHFWFGWNSFEQNGNVDIAQPRYY